MAVARSTSRDVVVLGGGLAGLRAASVAAAAGASVTLLEKQDHLGGSSELSAGMFWTAPDLDAYRRRVPDGDTALGRLAARALRDRPAGDPGQRRPRGRRAHPRRDGLRARILLRRPGVPHRPHEPAAPRAGRGAHRRADRRDRAVSRTPVPRRHRVGHRTRRDPRRRRRPGDGRLPGVARAPRDVHARGRRAHRAAVEPGQRGRRAGPGALAGRGARRGPGHLLRPPRAPPGGGLHAGPVHALLAVLLQPRHPGRGRRAPHRGRVAGRRAPHPGPRAGRRDDRVPPLRRGGAVDATGSPSRSPTSVASTASASPWPPAPGTPWRRPWRGSCSSWARSGSTPSSSPRPSRATSRCRAWPGASRAARRPPASSWRGCGRGRSTRSRSSRRSPSPSAASRSARTRACWTWRGNRSTGSSPSAPTSAGSPATATPAAWPRPTSPAPWRARRPPGWSPRPPPAVSGEVAAC